MYNGKIISFMGDSITSFKGVSSEGNACYYPTAFLTDPADTYWAKLVDHFGFTLGVNDGWSGSRIGWDGVQEVGNMVGKDRNLACWSRISKLGKNGTPDYIVVYAGTNDIRREPLGEVGAVDWDTVLDKDGMTLERWQTLPINDFAHSTAALYSGLRMAYPDAHILALLPMWVDVENTTGEEVEARVNRFDALYIEVLKKFGIDYVDLRELCSFADRAVCTGDDPSLLHPSRQGMQMIFELVAKYYAARE